MSRASPAALDGLVMRERPSVWPLLAYGALSLILFARRADEPGGVQFARRNPPRLSDLGRAVNKGWEVAANQPSGHRAHAPWAIPFAGWKDIFWRVYANIDNNRLLSVAAGVVFYAILALFPALAALVSLYGLFADAGTIDSNLSMLAGVLPGGALGILHEQLQRLTSRAGSGLSFGFAFGLLVALWSANSGSKAVIDALNVAYGVKETRSFVRLSLVAFAFTLGGIVALMLAVSAIVAAPIVLAYLGLGGLATGLIAALRWLGLLLLAIIGLAVLYRYAPNRPEPLWVWLSPGSLAAAILWLVASLLFSWYIANFGTYDVTYGSLGAAIGMMMWMWISMIVVLAGAEFNAETKRQAKRTRAA